MPLVDFIFQGRFCKASKNSYIKFLFLCKIRIQIKQKKAKDVKRKQNIRNSQSLKFQGKTKDR